MILLVGGLRGGGRLFLLFEIGGVLCGGYRGSEILSNLGEWVFYFIEYMDVCGYS